MFGFSKSIVIKPSYRIITWVQLRERNDIFNHYEMGTCMQASVIEVIEKKRKYYADLLISLNRMNDNDFITIDIGERIPEILTIKKITLISIDVYEEHFMVRE